MDAMRGHDSRRIKGSRCPAVQGEFPSAPGGQIEGSDAGARRGYVKERHSPAWAGRIRVTGYGKEKALLTRTGLSLFFRIGLAKIGSKKNRRGGRYEGNGGGLQSSAGWIATMWRCADFGHRLMLAPSQHKLCDRIACPVEFRHEAIGMPTSDRSCNPTWIIGKSAGAKYSLKTNARCAMSVIRLRKASSYIFGISNALTAAQSGGTFGARTATIIALSAMRKSNPCLPPIR
jgi:hypothetical protein